MQLNLPQQPFLTIQELAKRWKVEETNIVYLIESKQLAIADKYAALRGKRSTVIKVREPELKDEQKTFYEEIKSIAQELASDIDSPEDEIVWIDISDDHVLYWDECIENARLSLPEVQQLVILMSDIVAFELKNSKPEHLERKKTGRRELQLDFILQVIAELSFDPLNIPHGGKAQIESICILRKPELFTIAGFGHAWDAARERDLLKHSNSELYSKR